MVDHKYWRYPIYMTTMHYSGEFPMTYDYDTYIPFEGDYTW